MPSLSADAAQLKRVMNITFKAHSDTVFYLLDQLAEKVSRLGALKLLESSISEEINDQVHSAKWTKSRQYSSGADKTVNMIEQTGSDGTFRKVCYSTE